MRLVLAVLVVALAACKSNKVSEGEAKKACAHCLDAAAGIDRVAAALAASVPEPTGSLTVSGDAPALGTNTIVLEASTASSSTAR
jgi:hypothetical protein